MAEAEEPQFMSLQARIAALNQAKVVNGEAKHQTFGKRAPPPLPQSTPAARPSVPTNRPSIPSRTQTTNNPPIVTYGSSVTKQANNQPIGVKNNLLPPPPVDRDQPTPTQNARTPPLPARNAPPPLPGRKASQPSPMLPPRKSSTQLVRRGSNESTLSFSSTVSGMSLSQGGSSTTSASSVESRKMPPPLSEAKLPPLPPTKRELEEKARINKARDLEEKERAKANKIPLVTVKSESNIWKDPPVVERSLMPKMPPRPGGGPRLPVRQPSRSNLAEEARPSLPTRRPTEDAKPSIPSRRPTEDAVPSQPPRKLPPAATTRNILNMGFNNKKETPNPAPTPAPTVYARPRPTGPAIQELTDRDFDSVVMACKPVFVKFYSPHCLICTNLAPDWKQLGEDFAFASDKVIIAKLDVFEYKMLGHKYGVRRFPDIMLFDGYNETPEKCPGRDLDSLTRFLEERTGISAADARIAPQATPPPIPLSSKPTFAQVQAIQSRPAPTQPPTSSCLLCRDFSGPDHVASQYPRSSIPRNCDMTGYLADVLCTPFSSATDKARAIFTWLHHEIAYDTKAFFNKAIKHVTPTDTITSGLAVCGGYAGLYVAIALKAGLECVMVTGHGKGFGYSALKPGERIPPCDPSGHAWNAVRIDGGQWKLLDACWGAGNVGDGASQTYNKKFAPEEFTMSNDQFGLKHFPGDEAYFFRSDGRPQSWEEYMIGPLGVEPLQLYSNIYDHGLSGTSFSPPQKQIPVNSNEVVRFQFSKICEHWDHEVNGQGKPYCMILKINGVDGRKDDFVPFESNEFWWWADVPARDLGAPGMSVSCMAVTTVSGKDARGMTRKEYLGKKGRCGMGFGGISAWDLV